MAATMTEATAAPLHTWRAPTPLPGSLGPGASTGVAGAGVMLGVGVGVAVGVGVGATVGTGVGAAAGTGVGAATGADAGARGVEGGVAAGVGPPALGAGEGCAAPSWKETNPRRTKVTSMAADLAIFNYLNV